MKTWFDKHLVELKNRLIIIVVTIMIISTFTFIFGIETVTLNGLNLYYPSPFAKENIVSQIFIIISENLVPKNVELIVTNPVDAIFLQIKISLFLGVLLGFPIIIDQIGKFIGPALYKHEKQLILKLVVPTTILFIIGSLFAYFLVLPFTINFLYKFAFDLGVTAFLNISEFISFILLFVIAFGIIFLLPVFMIGLTSLGIVEPESWKKNWRYAILFFVIFGAVITPDGSGVTLFMVAGPMILLYYIGYLISLYTKNINMGK